MLSEKLAKESYQIAPSESLLLAAILENEIESKTPQSFIRYFHIANDLLLNEAAIVQIFLIPETYWKVVLVTPVSTFSERVDSVVNQVLYYLISVSLLVFLLGYWLLGKSVVNPFHHLVSQLSSNKKRELDESSKNEFGLIARHINHKTQQLTKANREIIIVMEKREQADKLRRVSEKRFKAIAKNAPDAIVSVDGSGRVIDWNPAATKIFKYKKQEIKGRLFSRLFVPDESQSQLIDIDQYIKGDIDSLHTPLIQIQALRADGLLFTAEFSATSWKTDKGRFFSIFLRDISMRMEAEYKLRHQALHDPLTQLPNRSLFNDRLSHALVQAKRDATSVAVMIIDLDNFKIINDTLGHATGDLLLQSVAEKLLREKRATDTISRLGGDEFGVVQTNITDPSQVLLFSSRLRESIAETTTINKNTFQVGCSIGVTVFPDDSHEADDLLRNADMAMYRAKEDGRNSVRFFVEAMDREIQNRREILDNISIALKQNQFAMHFQPLIDLKQNKIVGAEALIRWFHPEKGFISPAEFIPIAEQTKAINEIGFWVIRRVCQLINQMDELKLPQIRIALNISPIQFKRENIFETLQIITSEENVSPTRIECEITESAVMDDVERVIEIMHNLNGAGYKLSIDDFGTGYSSLSYLKRFPINKIKIDQSFITDIVTDEDSASIAKAIIKLGHSMSLEVLAEGVETEAQQQWLIDHHCDLIQGYFKAKPMPFAEFVDWVKANY